jgi:hypothetical protein
MGQVHQSWWRICREIDVFSRLEFHMFYVLYSFVTYLLTLSRKIIIGRYGDSERARKWVAAYVSTEEDYERPYSRN